MSVRHSDPAISPGMLTELSAILRAIALSRKNAAPALRHMAKAYELTAAFADKAEPRA